MLGEAAGRFAAARRASRGAQSLFMPRVMAGHINFAGYDRCTLHHPTWELNPQGSSLRVWGEKQAWCIPESILTGKCDWPGQARCFPVSSYPCQPESRAEGSRNLKHGTGQNPLLHALLHDATVAAPNGMLLRECRVQPKQKHDIL